MARHDAPRDGEVRVIAVTPFVGGVLRPVTGLVASLALVVVVAERVSALRHVAGWLALILVGPFLLLSATRTWRWRSHRIIVTNQRIVVRGGVLRRYAESVELGDVLTTRVEQHLGQRLTRRGRVYVETANGSVVLGTVRHPAALARIVDAQRQQLSRPQWPLDTVFEANAPRHFTVAPAPPRQHRDG